MLEEYNTTGVDADVSTMIAVLPFVYMVAVFVTIYHWITGKEPESFEYGDTPKEVLQMRYARGEIDNLEYLERMSRL